MKMEQMREIANAVLYEGYLLYPYRQSAIKNRQRWTFGVVYPRAYSEANGGIEPWSMQTQCLVRGDALLTVHVRFLHLLTRSITSTNSSPETDHAAYENIASRLVNEDREEGVEREIVGSSLRLSELVERPVSLEIHFPAWREETEEETGKVVRVQQPITGSVQIVAERVDADLFKLTVRIENSTPVQQPETHRHNTILSHTFVSTHTILRVEQGAFLSLLDPPNAVKSLAQSCQNIRTWPVLVGDQGETSSMLSSPIILYDYPQLAPESPGALFDGTEIDEILTLRILTLSDAEKEELRRGDVRGREILERTEALTPEDFMKLHGTIRSLQPVEQKTENADAPLSIPTYGGAFPGEDYPPPSSVRVGEQQVKAGDRVRLHPKVRADAFDMLLDGKTARVETIMQDFENRLYLVVTLDDDPGREQWDERVLPGHRFYFFPEEVEPLGKASERTV